MHGRRQLASFHFGSVISGLHRVEKGSGKSQKWVGGGGGGRTGGPEMVVSHPGAESSLERRSGKFTLLLFCHSCLMLGKRSISRLLLSSNPI